MTDISFMFKRLFLLLTVLAFEAAILSAMGREQGLATRRRPDGTLEATISRNIDLKGRTVSLEKGTVLHFKGGCLRNGTIVGNASSVELSSDKTAFDGVLLDGTWKGAISDQCFAYRRGDDHTTLIANVIRFNRASLTRKDYNIRTWRRVYVNADSLSFDGGGAVLHFQNDKGKLNTGGRWGDAYDITAFFATDMKKGSRSAYSFRNLNIEDKASTGRFIVYHYFEIAGRRIAFDNVDSDGCGALQKVYNVDTSVDEMTFRDCDVRTCQFAVEFLNYKTLHKDLYCKKISFKDCTFFNYAPQIYVGLLSICGDSPTGLIEIDGCTFDGRVRDGNLELTSGANVSVRNCKFYNEFLMSDDIGYNRVYECSGSTFVFTGKKANTSYKFAGEKIIFHDNTLVFQSDDISFIEFKKSVREVRMYRNTFECRGAGEMKKNATTLAFTSLSENNRAKAYMSDNKVIIDGKSSKGQYIFRMPFVYYGGDGVPSGDYFRTGFRKAMVDVPSAGTTLRLTDEPKEKVVTLTIEGRTAGSAANRDLAVFSSGRNRYRLSRNRSSLVLYCGSKALLTTDISKAGGKDFTFDLVLSQYDTDALKVVSYIDGAFCAQAVTRIVDPFTFGGIEIRQAPDFKISRAGISRGGVLQ